MAHRSRGSPGDQRGGGPKWAAADGTVNDYPYAMDGDKGGNTLPLLANRTPNDEAHAVGFDDNNDVRWRWHAVGACARVRCTAQPPDAPR